METVVKFGVLSCFIMTFAWALFKDRIYVVPLALLCFSNINGLLGWEDFALKGAIKFQDYGLLIVLGLMVTYAFAHRQTEPEYMQVMRSTFLYNAINAFWLFYAAIFIFSILVQNSVLWPVKMARTFFYGLIIYLIYRNAMADPIAKFEKLYKFMMWATLLFGLIYVAYNLTGLPIYPKGEHETFNLSGLENEVKRNFSGFPTYTPFFILYFTDRFMRGEGNPLFNLAGLSVLLLCVLMMLTRGTLIITFACMVVMVFYRRLDGKTATRLALAAAVMAIIVPIALISADSYYTVMLKRFEEFSTTGVASSGNAMVRLREFQHIVENVLDFDPLFGFGFTVVWALGYTSSIYHGGSADNGYSNLIGTTGFVGLAFFLIIIAAWVIINRRLQAMKMEHLSRVNFVFILFILASMMNGAGPSYMSYFCIFMAYDLFAYAYFKHKQKRDRQAAVTYDQAVMRGGMQWT